MGNSKKSVLSAKSSKVANLTNGIYTIDRLEMKFKSNSPLIKTDSHSLGNGLKIKRIEQSSDFIPNSYRFHYTLEYNGCDVGILSAVHKEHYIDKCICFIHLKNWIFYHPIFSQLISDMTDVFFFELEFDSIVNIEIALDTDSNLCENFKSSYNGLVDGSLKLLNSSSIPSQFNPESNNPMYKFYNGESIMYNKTKELVKSKKAYITDFHRKNGLEGDVHRFEMTLDKADIRRLNLNIELEKLGSQVYLQGLVKHYIDSRMILRTNTKSNPSREQKLPILKLQDVNNNGVIYTKFEIESNKVNTYDQRFLKLILQSVIEDESLTVRELLFNTVISSNQKTTNWFTSYCEKNHIDPLNFNSINK